MIWRGLLGSIIRYLLAMLIVGPLLSRGIISQEQADQLLGEGVSQIVAGLIALALLVWSFRNQILARVWARTALELPPTATLKDVRAEVKAKPTAEKLAEAFRKERVR